MTENKKGRVYVAKGGCAEDCFNCPFPDCYKPALQILADENKRGKKERDKRNEVDCK